MKRGFRNKKESETDVVPIWLGWPTGCIGPYHVKGWFALVGVNLGETKPFCFPCSPCYPHAPHIFVPRFGLGYLQNEMSLGGFVMLKDLLCSVLIKRPDSGQKGQGYSQQRASKTRNIWDKWRQSGAEIHWDALPELSARAAPSAVLSHSQAWPTQDKGDTSSSLSTTLGHPLCSAGIQGHQACTK